MDAPKGKEKGTGWICSSSDLLSWRSGHPTPSFCFALSTFKSKLVIVGGEEKGKATNKLWTSVDGIKWQSSLPPMPTKRLGPSVFSSNSPKCLIVGGGCLRGAREFSFKEVDVIEVFVDKQWFKVPSLSMYPSGYTPIYHTTLHNGRVYYVPQSSKAIYFCTVESLLASTKRGSKAAQWTQFKCPPGGATTLASFGQRLVAVGTPTKVCAYSPLSRSWIFIEHLKCDHMYDFGNVYFLSPTLELLLRYIDDPGTDYDKTTKWQLKTEPFNRKNPFQISALHRLEALDIPVVTALREVYSKVESIVGIDDMKPADWKVAGEPWESLLTKWVCHGGDGGYKCRPDWDTLLKILATEGYGELSQRISSFLSGYKTLEESCLLVIVSVIEEQNCQDREELLSRFPDYVATKFKNSIIDAVLQNKSSR